MSQVQIAKAATRAYNGNNYEYTDLTAPLMIVPNIWGLGQQLNLFGTETTNQESITLEEITKGFGLITDVHRGARHQVSMDHTRRMMSFAVPRSEEHTSEL